jgi:Protein of unknown function (DUF4242)
VPVFMIERRYATEFESSAEGVDGINRINDEEGVRWLYSFLSADKRKTYCLYEAPSPSTSPSSRNCTVIGYVTGLDQEMSRSEISHEAVHILEDGSSSRQGGGCDLGSGSLRP